MSKIGDTGGKIIRILKRFPIFLLKFLYVLPFLLFGAWLFKLVYLTHDLPHVEAKKPAELTEVVGDDGVFKKILLQKDTVPRDHFHVVDEYVSRPEHISPTCLTCHGTYPHSKEEKVRSILNFHGGFIACSVCHAREKHDEHLVYFAWVDRETGAVSKQVQGEYGKYPAKIYPIQITKGVKTRIFRPVSEEAARQFLEFKDQYTPDQIAQAKAKLHEHISAKPVFCSDCHKKDGYLDYKELGFPEQRIAHLNSTEIVGMVEKYKKFYLPSKIDFGLEKPVE
jgi:cytochrome c553